MPDLLRALHDKLAALPKADLGYSWNARDSYTKSERIVAHGQLAAVFAFVLNNRQALAEALAVPRLAEAPRWLATYDDGRQVAYTFNPGIGQTTAGNVVSVDRIFTARIIQRELPPLVIEEPRDA